MENFIIFEKNLVFNEFLEKAIIIEDGKSLNCHKLYRSYCDLVQILLTDNIEQRSFVSPKEFDSSIKKKFYPDFSNPKILKKGKLHWNNLTITSNSVNYMLLEARKKIGKIDENLF